MATPTSRRALLGALATAPIVLAVPAAAMSAGSAEFAAILDANDAAKRRFNSLPFDLETADEPAYERETRALIDASLRADRATPTTWQEFGRWVEHISEDGEFAIDDDNAERLLQACCSRRSRHFRAPSCPGSPSG